MTPKLRKKCKNCEKSLLNPSWFYCDRKDCRLDIGKNRRHLKTKAEK
jgi:hypothetical protein